MRHLLIDADVLAYKAATSVEKAVEWEPDQWTYHADLNEAKQAFDDQLDAIMVKLGGRHATLALTHPVNFRKAILPTYKANRKGLRKPLVLAPLRKWLVEEMGAKMKPGLEGDDVLGILATVKHTDERIIVSIDKDMRSIPGLFSKDGETIEEVSEVDADHWHMMQTLTGDPVDGYTGCRGVGKVKADRILQDAINANAHLYGTMTHCVWPAIVATYEKYGFTAEDALVQARVARILRASDYNFKTNQPILWSPPHG